MQGILSVVLIAAAVFGVCFLADKSFEKLFRSQPQYRSQLAVRPSRKYASFGLILAVVGLAAVFQGTGADAVLLVGGCFVVVLGIGLVIYYLTTGLFYDDESFLYTSLGKKKRCYRYEDIRTQQLYNAQGSIVVELYMADGNSISVHGNMNGAYAFLDKAFAEWCRQRGIQEAACSFHDPANSCWFPPTGEAE